VITGYSSRGDLGARRLYEQETFIYFASFSSSSPPRFPSSSSLEGRRQRRRPGSAPSLKERQTVRDQLRHLHTLYAGDRRQYGPDLDNCWPRPARGRRQGRRTIKSTKGRVSTRSKTDQHRIPAGCRASSTMQAHEVAEFSPTSRERAEPASASFCGLMLLRDGA